MFLKSNNKSFCFFVIFILICFCSCQEKKDCEKFIQEEYLEEQVDSFLEREANEYRDTLLKRFDETPIRENNRSAYHLLFYSSHGYGKSVKFEKNNSRYFLSRKCIRKEGGFPDCENYQVEVSEKEWNEFEEMIYEFDFWTEEKFRVNTGALDGFVYFLEGNRPEAERCGKRTYQFIGRSSPRFDKMGALCAYISEYEEHFDFKHGQVFIK